MKQPPDLLGPSLLAGVCGLGLLAIGQLLGLFLIVPAALGVAAHVAARRERAPMDDDEALDAAHRALLADVQRTDAEARAKESP